MDIYNTKTTRKLNICERKSEIMSSMQDLRRGVCGKVDEGTTSFEA